MTTLDLRGAAALMKVHPRTVESMAREGRIPAAKIGRAYVLMERDVLDFIEQQIAGQTARRGGGQSAGNVVSAAAPVGSSGGGAA